MLPRVRRRLKIAMGGKVPAFTADVSPRGFSAEVMQVWRIGSVVHGSISLEGREFPFTGEVSWSKAGDPRLSIRGRFGVRFTGIDNDFFALFERTLRRAETK